MAGGAAPPSIGGMGPPPSMQAVSGPGSLP